MKANEKQAGKGVKALKLQEFASRLKLSNNALYKAIRREGYTAKELTDKRGNITLAGMKILRRIYPEDAEEQQQEPEQQQREPEKEKESAEKELQSLREQLAETRERAEKWERLYLDLQDKTAEERAEMQQQQKALQVLLAQQQDINRRLLMNPIKRLFSGRKKDLETGGKVE